MNSNEQTHVFRSWSIQHPEKMLRRSWENEGCVVYDGVSGNTHLLSPFAGEVLGLLISDSYTVESLLLEFSNDFSGQDAANAFQEIENILFELRNINLVCDTNR